MKIICIGWNYPRHNAEMNREDTPQSPVVFLKPDTALLRENRPFFLPDFAERFEYECELVYRINRLGRHIAEKFAHKYYSEVALGVDITARDLQVKCKAEGEPWEISKAFDQSAVISKFIPIDSLPNRNAIEFSMSLNDRVVQRARSTEMIFSIDRIIAYVSQFFTLKIGDLIYTGTPAGVGKLTIGDHLRGFIGEQEMFSFYIK